MKTILLAAAILTATLSPAFAAWTVYDNNGNPFMTYQQPEPCYAMAAHWGYICLPG